MASSRATASAIDALLPQMQCRKCGYPACEPYAHAIASGEAAINRCAPGGRELIARLAELTGAPELAPDPSCGSAGERRVARIDEDRCIGCTLCIQACPVDAIVGASKQMHTVIAAECNGCELCLPPCPVDCIDLLPLPEPNDAERERLARQWKARFEARTARLERDKARRAERLAAKRLEHQRTALHSTTPDGKLVDRRAILRAAIERARRLHKPG